MTETAQNIRAAIEASGYEPADLAHEIGITPSALSQWMTGSTTPTLLRLMRLAEIIGMSLDELVNGQQRRDGRVLREPNIQAPVLSKVQAGKWGNVVTPFTLPQEAKFVELYRKPVGVAIALQLDGYSMYPEYGPEDIIVIDTGLEPQPGSLVVAVLEGEEEATFKRYRPRGFDLNKQPIIELAPLNPDYPTLRISAEQPGRIVGTLIQHIRFPSNEKRR